MTNLDTACMTEHAIDEYLSDYTMDGDDTDRELALYCVRCTEQFTAAVPPAPAAVPPGYVLVPIEPTPETLDAMANAVESSADVWTGFAPLDAKVAYRAMIAAGERPEEFTLEQYEADAVTLTDTHIGAIALTQCGPCPGTQYGNFYIRFARAVLAAAGEKP